MQSLNKIEIFIKSKLLGTNKERTGFYLFSMCLLLAGTLLFVKSAQAETGCKYTCPINGTYACTLIGLTLANNCINTDTCTHGPCTGTYGGTKIKCNSGQKDGLATCTEKRKNCNTGSIYTIYACLGVACSYIGGIDAPCFAGSWKDHCEGT